MTVIAYEAKDLRSIRLSSKYIAWVALGLYLFCAIGEFINVEWTNPALFPKYLSRPTSHAAEPHRRDTEVSSTAIIVVAAFQAGKKRLAGLLNGCMIFSALSAANTSLYISSRVLYGMTRDINPQSRLAVFSGLSRVWHKTGVPVRALWLSFISFVWLPFLRWKGGISVTDVRNPGLPKCKSSWLTCCSYLKSSLSLPVLPVLLRGQRFAWPICDTGSGRHFILPRCLKSSPTKSSQVS